jgi:hypothetical protein
LRLMDCYGYNTEDAPSLLTLDEYVSKPR